MKDEQTVQRTPIPEDASHGEVCGNKSQGRRKKFARTADFVVLREDALNPDELAKMRALLTAVPSSQLLDDRRSADMRLGR